MTLKRVEHKLGDQIELRRFVRRELETVLANVIDEAKPPFMTRAQVAGYFGVSETSVRRNEGLFARIRRTQEGTKWLYLREDVEREAAALKARAYAPNEDSINAAKVA